MTACALQLLKTLGRLRRCENGASAIEFAAVAPFLILLYLGMSDLTLALNFNQKLKSATSAVNDLVGQTAEASQAEIEEIFLIARPILNLSSLDQLSIRTTNVRIDAGGKGEVVWSVEHNAAPIDRTQALLPDDIVAQIGDEFVVTTSSYAYRPLFAHWFKDEYSLTSTIHGKARGRKGVSCLDCGT